MEKTNKFIKNLPLIYLMSIGFINFFVVNNKYLLTLNIIGFIGLIILAFKIYYIKGKE